MKWSACQLIVVALVAGCSKPHSNSTVAESFIKLWNSGQHETLSGLCDSTFRIFDYDGTTYNREEAVYFYGWHMRMKTTWGYGKVTVKGDTILVDSLNESSDWMTLVNVDTIRYENAMRFILNNGRITELHIPQIADASRLRLETEMLDFVEWIRVSEKRSRRGMRVMGCWLNFNKTEYNAGEWLSLIVSWRIARMTHSE